LAWQVLVTLDMLSAPSRQPWLRARRSTKLTKRNEALMSESKEEEQTRPSNLLEEKLFKSRSISIFGGINEKLARSVAQQLLALSEDSNDPITLYISSPGGHVESGDVIYDMIKFIRPTVRVVGTGWVASAATNIYLAAKKENRYSLPNTRYLVHQPSGGSRGDATDIKIQMEEILKTKRRINEIIAKETGQPLERVEKDTDRDYWMSAEEAIEYGIVHRIVSSIDEIE
jgi:ATP-dependent Clp protease protease subunit